MTRTSTHTSSTRSRARALAPLALAGVLALTGCGLTPGTAARVNGSSVSISDVDLLTRVQCRDISSNGQGQATSVAKVRAQSVNALIDSTLSKGYADTQRAGYDPRTLQQQMAQVTPVIATLDKADQGPVRDLIEGFRRQELRMLTIGQKLLAKQATSKAGTTKPSSDEALNAAYRARDSFVKKADVEIDPRYGPGAKGVAGAGDGSVSTAVSDFAKQGMAKQPAAAFTSGLPTSQKCG